MGLETPEPIVYPPLPPPTVEDPWTWGRNADIVEEDEDDDDDDDIQEEFE
jgi:hypothetical protein